MSIITNATDKTSSLSRGNRVRQYRDQITSSGQASPKSIGRFVAEIFKEKFLTNTPENKPLSILDVGCGLGDQMRLITELLPGLFHNIQGADWSPATVEYHRNNCETPYRSVTLCNSNTLPYDDNSFDIALSMENLEHLYYKDSIYAIKELSRVSRYVIITTPLPSRCINFQWIYPELVDAILDPIPLSLHDFICLESAVHKSTIFQKSMLDAGFTVFKANHGFYFSPSDNIHPGFIICLGIEPIEIDQFESTFVDHRNIDYKELYITLLAKSAQLDKRIKAHPFYTPPEP